MARRYLFADEAGDFNFSRNPRASKYFIVCYIALDSCSVGADMLELRRELIWDGYPVGGYFHATEDKQVVRDKVFERICRENFKIYAQILEKSKAQPQVRSSNERFYKYGWLYLSDHALPKIVKDGETELLITTASIATKKAQASFTNAVNDVLQQIASTKWATYFCPAATDPCLQVADYCIWAIQRKWELSDSRSYDLIKDKIEYEYDLWAHGNTHYY